MKKYVFLAAFALMSSFTVQADEPISDAEKALIGTLLEQMGQASADVSRQFSQMFTQQLTAFLKQSSPEMDPKGFDIIEEEVNLTIEDELLSKGAIEEMMYPIYAKYFTEPELEQMIEFNGTALGQKIIKVMPSLAQEGMLAGQQFAQTLAPLIEERVRARLEAEGIR